MIFKTFLDHAEYSVSFQLVVSNMSSVIMKFKLVIKENTKVAVRCNDFDCYSIGPW